MELNPRSTDQSHGEPMVNACCQQAKQGCACNCQHGCNSSLDETQNLTETKVVRLPPTPPMWCRIMAIVFIVAGILVGFGVIIFRVYDDT